jgi:hypothetical protein
MIFSNTLKIKGVRSMLGYPTAKRRMSRLLLASILIALLMIGIMSIPTNAASSTTWSQAGYDNVSKTWTPGNTVRYYEGDWVPYRANASGYVPTGLMIAFDQDYRESGGAIGYDGARNWFIGPMVPYGNPGNPAIFTKANISAYALATYGKDIIEPNTQFNGEDAFTVNDPIEVTIGGGDTVLRYRVEPNIIGYIMGEPTAEVGSFIHALMTYYGGSWSMYYESHLAESGAPNLFEGGTVLIGAGGYTGSNLHVTFDRVGQKTIPLPTKGLNEREIPVEKIWVNLSDAVPVTIKLMAQNGPSGTPYVAETIVLDGVVDTNKNPEVSPWHGIFKGVPIYFYVNKVPVQIIYSVVEDPVPTGFKTPVYGGNAADGFTVTNELDLGCLKIDKDFTGYPEGFVLPDSIDVLVTGPYGYSQTWTLLKADGWAKTVCGLVPGNYTVAELTTPGWTPSYNPTNRTAAVVAGNAASAVQITITNTLDKGCLKITKEFLSYPADLDLPDFIDVLVTGPYGYSETWTLYESEGWTKTLCDLVPGNYTVNEISVPGWTVSYNPLSRTVAVVAGCEASAAQILITNTYEVCEQTIWAKLNDGPSTGFKGTGNWGWYSGPLEEGTYEFELWAGAAKNDTTKGMLVGILKMTYKDGCVSFKVKEMYMGVLVSYSHVYVSQTAGVPSFPKDFTKDTLAEDTICGFTGSIYFAYHSVVMLPCSN